MPFPNIRLAFRTCPRCIHGRRGARVKWAPRRRALEPAWCVCAGCLERIGETLLIAVMRAHVASRFGDQVDLP